MESRKRIRDHVFAGATWIRAFFMLLFVLIYGVAEILVAAVALLQFAIVLFTGEGNPRLGALGRGLASFIRSIVLYCTFNADEKPFPFADWPGEGT